MKHVAIAISAAVLGAFQVAASPATAQEKVIYPFLNNTTDGANPMSSLVFDTQGNLYGTTYGGGGANGYGTVFELSPQGDGSWKETILLSFPGAANGLWPTGAPVIDSAGNLYGLAAGGAGDGMAYELSPPAKAGDKWTETVLYKFQGSPDGDNPVGSLVFDKQGNLYGATTDGGSSIFGSVFELAPGTGGTWTETTIFSFTGSATGTFPMAGLIVDGEGNLYGTTQQGGSAADGVVYELSPPSSGTTWNETVIWNFSHHVPDGEGPESSLLLDSKGNLFGTCPLSTSGSGIAFELSPPAQSGGAWTEQILYTFPNSTSDGAGPDSNLIFDADGNLWGTTEQGGPNLDATGGDGSIFELTPQTGGTWKEQPVYFFGSSKGDGFTTTAGLIEDSSGNFYGTTKDGGNGVGTVFEFTPLPIAATPTFSPDPGIGYTSVQSVEISDTTPDAAIYYTIDGSTPTTSSKKYSAAISVSSSETIKAIATAGGYNNSAVGTATYTVHLPQAATPTFSLKSGVYRGVQHVTLNDATAGAAIYYTTNGKTPTTASTKYSTAIVVSATETIEAIAAAAGHADSAVVKAAYTIEKPTATPVFSVRPGKYVKAQSVKITDATPGAAIYYTTNGTAPTTKSTRYAAAITVARNETIKAIAMGKGDTNSAIAEAVYTIESPTPTIKPAGGAVTATTAIALADSAKGAAIYYTISTTGSGTVPTAKSTKYIKPFTLTKNSTVEAIAIAPGLASSPVAAAKFTIK